MGHLLQAWHWPQWVIVGLWFLSLVNHASHNGEPMKLTYNFPLRLLGVALYVFLLAAGGFF